MGTTEHMWSGRLLFAVIASLFLTKATQAQTIISVASGSDLVNALTTVDNNPSTNYRINFTQSVTLDFTTTLPAINTSANLTITGNNKTLDGGGVQRGFFVYAGSVGLVILRLPTPKRSVALVGMAELPEEVDLVQVELFLWLAAAP